MSEEILSVDEFMKVDESEEIDSTYQEIIPEEKKEIRLKEVGDLCKQADELNKKVLQLTQELADEKAKLDNLLRITIPEKLESVGLQELKLDSGKKISIVDDLTYNITEEKRTKCMQWLRDNNFDSIIKNTVTAQFKKGEDEMAIKIFRELLSKGLDVNKKEDVHWQTMKAFLKEQCKNNNLSTSDKDLFGVYEFKLAKIK